MSDTKIPASTPFSVYCQARAVIAMGHSYPTSMCGNDPRLLFAAMKAVDDAKRREIETYGRGEALPSETEILAALDKAFPRHERVADALHLEPIWSVMLVWDGDEYAPTERRIVDVIIGGRFRPTRATWQKLLDAKLPMCSWEEASESWDLSEAQRDLEREQK